MNPENIKVNGQAVQTEKKELTPVQQWDQLAFQVIYKELAPKGFKKITSGAFKGQQVAVCAGPGLAKVKVTSAQRIAAQLVRGFRDKTREGYQQQLSLTKAFSEHLKWWQVIERAAAKSTIKVMESIISDLDKVGIK